MQAAPWDERHAVESRWTDLFREVPGTDLLNILSGARAPVATPEIRARVSARISAGLKKAYLNPEYHAKLSAAHAGKPKPGHGDKVRAALKGRKRGPLSPEHWAKISASVKRSISEQAGADAA